MIVVENKEAMTPLGRYKWSHVAPVTEVTSGHVGVWGLPLFHKRQAFAPGHGLRAFKLPPRYIV